MQKLWAVLLLLIMFLPTRAQDNHPGLVLWSAIRKALAAPDGMQYFAENLKDASIPGGVNGLRGLPGTVVSAESTESYTLIKLSMERDAPAEVALKLFGSARKNRIEEGATVLFEGIAREFTRDPFMLVFELDDRLVFEIIGEPPSK